MQYPRRSTSLVWYESILNPAQSYKTGIILVAMLLTKLLRIACCMYYFKLHWLLLFLSLYSFTRWGVICYSKSQKHCQALLLLHTNSEQKKICQIFNFIVKLVSFFALAKFSAGTRFIPKSFIELEEFCSNRAYLFRNHYKKTKLFHTKSCHWMT